MNKIAVNPYLPSWEYVPDGEPYVFGDRIYIYGSHDLAHGTSYCEDDYVGWSAPIDNLADWTYEGVIYRKDQDPDNHGGADKMFAPDVAKGLDGRYYLYYGTSVVDHIGVAVSESPAGPFEYYGKIAYADGRTPDGIAFDPGLYVEGDQVYLYYGFSMKEPLPETSKHAFISKMKASYMVQLDSDMKTVISDPIVIAPGNQSAKGTSFEAHPFFEASSMRKIGERYYFIYSSLQGHELCYAIGDDPCGPFEYGGVIISNGDLGLVDQPRAYYANNHGSLVAIEDSYYIFYHRHTHGTHYSRQGCAEKIEILENGHIPQVEMTSCGLSQEALPSNRTYGAYILCLLKGPQGAGQIPSKPEASSQMPFLVASMEEEKSQRQLYLTNIVPKTQCGFKYLNFDGVKEVQLSLRGGYGNVNLFVDEAMTQCIGQIEIKEASSQWTTYSCAITPVEGPQGLYLQFMPIEGKMEFLEFCLQ